MKPMMTPLALAAVLALFPLRMEAVAPSGGALPATLRPEPQQRDSYDWKARHAAVLARNRTVKPDVVFFGDSIETTAQTGNLGMNVETVDRIDTQCQDLFRILLHAACRSGKNGNIHIFQLADILDYVIFGQFLRLVLSTLTANDAGHLKIGSCLKRLQCIVTDISISYHCCSNLFHLSILFWFLYNYNL